jgi:hypothetical protein
MACSCSTGTLSKGEQMHRQRFNRSTADLLLPRAPTTDVWIACTALYTLALGPLHLFS